MKDMLLLLVHLLTTIAKLLGPGGARAIVADSLLLKQQAIIEIAYLTGMRRGDILDLKLSEIEDKGIRRRQAERWN